jgi:P4 family phage/plasmid primase-like protien
MIRRPVRVHDSSELHPMKIADMEDEKEMPKDEVNKVPLLHSMEEIETLCSCLTPEWLHDNSNLLRLMMMLKGISPSDEMRDLFLKHSARSPTYADCGGQNANKWDSATPNGRISMGSLKHWAKKCSPERYFANAKTTYWSLVNQNNSNGYCEIFYNEMAGDLLYSNSHKCYYVYDARETLWHVSKKADINFLFVETTHAVLRKMMGDLPPANDEEESTKRKSQMKKLMKAVNACDGRDAITLVSAFLPALCRSDEDPANYFNQNSDLYPLANGVWKFSEKKLIPYDREHYFTFRIPIAYNPRADMTDICKASLDWFGQDTEVADFIQYWIGYCLTGLTSRQDFLIVWGTKAGNGKSLLWGEIMPIMLGPYFRTITSDALSAERVGNNDQLYNLNGARFAFLSEPRTARGTKIDNELVKTLTGDKSFTVEAKYKNAITFTLQAKIAMACNEMPELKFEDKGTYRRVKIAEQNCEFVDPVDFAKADKEAIQMKRVMMKDDAFIARLKENVEGLMRWALEGASRFIDNPRMEAPKGMSSAKDKAVSEGDVLGIWIRKNIRNLAMVKDAPANWQKKKIPFKRLKEMMNADNENLGQHKAGFNRRLTEKLDSLGFQMGGREDKGDQYIKYAAEVTFEEEEAEPNNANINPMMGL